MRRAESAVLGLFLLVTTPAARGATAFVEPQPEGFGINMSKVTLDQKTRSATATALARCCGAFKPDKAENLLLCSKLLGLSLLLDPDSTAAAANAKRLKDGSPVPVDTIWTPEKTAQTLLATARTLATSQAADNLKLAGFCFSLAADLAPQNDETVAAAGRFSKQRGDADWNGVVQPAKSAGQAGGAAPAHGRVTIKQGEQAPDLPFAKQQAQVTGLVVLDVLGRPSGRPLQILGTVYPHADPQRTHFEVSTMIGSQMGISFDEALSLVRMRHPGMEGGKSVRISFSDKYTPKDGGSAGLAFSLLLFSLLDGIQIDPDVAVTGDVTVDWQVRGIGAVAAKIAGAREGGKKYVVVPAANRTAVEDMVVLDGPEALLKVQVLSVGTVSEAVEVCRQDRRPDLAKALELFSKVQTAVGARDVATGLRMPGVFSTLGQVCAKSTNHLSAVYLLRMAKGWRPGKLSQEASIEEALTILCPFEQQLRAIQPMPQGTQTLLVDSMLRSEKLRQVSCEKVQPLADSINEYFSALADYQIVSGRDNELANLLRKSNIKATSHASTGTKKSMRYDQVCKRFEAQSQNVKAELAKLSVDRRFIEALTR